MLEFLKGVDKASTGVYTVSSGGAMIYAGFAIMIVLDIVFCVSLLTLTREAK